MSLIGTSLWAKPQANKTKESSFNTTTFEQTDEVVGIGYVVWLYYIAAAEYLWEWRKSREIDILVHPGPGRLKVNNTIAEYNVSGIERKRRQFKY